MQSLTEYVNWPGRFSLRALPLCEADAMALCVRSCFDLAPAAALLRHPHAAETV